MASIIAGGHVYMTMVTELCKMEAIHQPVGSRDMHPWFICWTSMNDC